MGRRHVSKGGDHFTQNIVRNNVDVPLVSEGGWTVTQGWWLEVIEIHSKNKSCVLRVKVFCGEDRMANFILFIVDLLREMCEHTRILIESWWLKMDVAGDCIGEFVSKKINCTSQSNWGRALSRVWVWENYQRNLMGLDVYAVFSYTGFKFFFFLKCRILLWLVVHYDLCVFLCQISKPSHSPVWSNAIVCFFNLGIFHIHPNWTIFVF